MFPLIELSDLLKIDNDVFWINTDNNGVVELNISTSEYKIYTKNDGLPSNYVLNIFKIGQENIIVTTSGLASLNKQSVEYNSAKPRLIIDKVFLGDTKLNLDNKEPMNLDYNYGALNFDLALLEYTKATSIEFQYILEGLSDQWTLAGNDDKYSFLNLPAGNYTFKAKGRSNYDDWSEIVEYSFNVSSPPWKSLWAYLLYALLLLGLLYWLLYLYKRKILYEHEIIKQQTQKQIANEASKAKSDFLARVSHEVRTPLNGVLGMGELMLDTKMDEEQQIYAETILASGQHLLEIINDILDLSKIEAGKLELELQQFDLLTLVDETVLSFTSQTQQSKIVFVCVFDPKLHRCRNGDVIRLKQILFNLLSNAFKFTKSGQITLEVLATDNPDLIQFKVTDTGIGINPETADELFKPFVQADPTITRKFGGTGLGLAIVKQLIEKMNGFIEIKKALKQGSLFQFQVRLETVENSQSSSHINPHYNIAVILNNETLRRSIANYLILLHQDFSFSISKNTTLIISDDEALEFSSKKPIPTLLIHPKSVITGPNRALITKLSLPVTFKKIQSICSGLKNEINLSINANTDLPIQVYNILLVEDNVINQQVSIEMIEKMGHMIDVVDNVEEAIIMLNRHNYDLLLVDYHLPEVTGLALIERWDNTNKIPILVVTADLTDEVYQSCHRLGVNQIVSKPFSQEQLFNAIEEAYRKP